jgi:cytochrome c oxidase subunit 3
MNKAKVTFYMLLTIIGGAIFVGSPGLGMEKFYQRGIWSFETRGGQILQFVNAETGKRAAIQEFLSE